MASLKILLLMFAVVAIVAVNAQDKSVEEEDDDFTVYSSKDLILGKREKGDVLAKKETVKKSASLVGKKVIEERTYNIARHTITQIKALDKASKNGASVQVTSGGIGEDSVSLRFKSQRLHGINYEVQIYAKKEEDE